MSIMSAPSSSIVFACAIAALGLRNRFPSEKELGVIFKIPIMRVLLPSWFKMDFIFWEIESETWLRRVFWNF